MLLTESFFLSVHIKEYRHALLKRLLNTLWSCWKALDSEWTISFETGYTRVWHPILCRSRHADARSCEAAASRCIHISLMRAGHWPLGSFNEYLKTPRALKTILAIDWSAGGTPEDRNMSYHPVCGRAEKYKPLLERAWKYTPVLDNEYQEHFAKQGERTGFAGRGIKELTSDD